MTPNNLVSNILILCFIFLAWVYLYIVFTGIGNIVRRLWKLEVAASAEQRLESFWVGWVHTIFFLQFWHLFFPVDWRSAVLLSLTGISGWLFGPNENYRQRLNQTSSKIFLSVIVLLGLWLAYRSSLGYWNYDSGLYHLNSVRWASTFPIVPGLGNLHGRLAFNSSYFLYVAALDVGFWKHKSAYLANGLLVLVFLVQVFLSWVKIFRAKDKAPVSDIFCGLLILPVFLLPDILVNISSPSPDLSIILLAMLVYIKFLRFVESRELKQPELIDQFFVIAVYAAAGLTIKLNFLVFGVSLLVLTYCLWSRKMIADSLRRSALLKIISGFIAVIFLWMFRGVILSGYIAYPVAWGSIPVDWRIPPASVINMANWTYAWARKPKVEHWSEVVGNWDWVQGWLSRATGNPYIVIFPFLLAAAGIVLVLIFRFSGKGRLSKDDFWFLLLPPGLAIIFWFFTAPDPRFGAIFFWILGVISFSSFIHLTKKPEALTAIVVLSFVLWQGVMGFGTKAAPKLLKDFKGNFVPVFEKQRIVDQWKTVSEERTELRDAHRVSLTTDTTLSGLVINVPRKGDQCWDAPLPCSIYVHPALRLRNPKSLRDGFIIDPKREDDVSVGMHDRWKRGGK